MEAQGVQGPVINRNSNFDIIKRVRIDLDDLITITTNKSGNACCNTNFFYKTIFTRLGNWHGLAFMARTFI
jgi:hypothetical protein